MLLSEFRRLTDNLDGDLLLLAGGEVDLLWHDDHVVSIDNETALTELESGRVKLEPKARVLHRA